jgi:ribosome-associated heat shock protein Hsp15
MQTDDRQRLDKWLWFSRLVKSRSLAARLVEDGHVRVNKVKVEKPATSIRTGDVLTLALGPNIRVLRVLAPGTRRGPAPQARELYHDLAENP